MNQEKREAVKKAILDSLAKGATRKAAYDAAGIGHTTFHRWLDSEDGFRAAVNVAEETAIGKVENALFDAATHINNAGNFNVGAMALFLCNRAPDRWKHVNRVQLEGAATGEALRVILENAWGGNGKTEPGTEGGK